MIPCRQNLNSIWGCEFNRLAILITIVRVHNNIPWFEKHQLICK